MHKLNNVYSFLKKINNLSKLFNQDLGVGFFCFRGVGFFLDGWFFFGGKGFVSVFLFCLFGYFCLLNKDLWELSVPIPLLVT